MYAVRDAIRKGGISYGIAECEIVAPSGQPPPRCGNYFAGVHSGKSRPGYANDNNLYEFYDFSLTLTARVTVPLDRVGDQQIARNLALVPLGQRQGFDAKLEQLRAFLHMNWRIVVLQNQVPPSANDNLAAWATGTVYGFCEPMRYHGPGGAEKLVGGEWFGSDPDSTDVGIVAEMRFGDAKRFQPVLAASGPFV